jgi:hypothetical protein
MSSGRVCRARYCCHIRMNATYILYSLLAALVDPGATPEIVGVMIQSGISPDHTGRTLPLPYLIIIWHTYYHEIKVNKGYQQRIRQG